jgi:hypothetical protein
MSSAMQRSWKGFEHVGRVRPRAAAGWVPWVCRTESEVLAVQRSHICAIAFVCVAARRRRRGSGRWAPLMQPAPHSALKRILRNSLSGRSCPRLINRPTSIDACRCLHGGARNIHISANMRACSVRERPDPHSHRSVRSPFQPLSLSTHQSNERYGSVLVCSQHLHRGTGTRQQAVSIRPPANPSRSLTSAC